MATKKLIHALDILIIQTLRTIFGALVQDAKVWKVPIKSLKIEAKILKSTFINGLYRIEFIYLCNNKEWRGRYGSDNYILLTTFF